ncbi:MAG: AbgT family transporter, partial [Tissierellales bacterium]|nr:AbgT family transporter [Tissierellales bacterium]
SGQAAATMPIMVPLADVLGISRQTAVLAYQFGDGFSNTIIPTASTLMATLAMAKISYDVWVKFYWKLFALWIIVGTVFIVIAANMPYGPF